MWKYRTRPLARPESTRFGSSPASIPRCSKQVTFSCGVYVAAGSSNVPLVETVDERPGGGNCGQAVRRLSMSLWAVRSIHSNYKVHGPHLGGRLGRATRPHGAQRSGRYRCSPHGEQERAAIQVAITDSIQDDCRPRSQPSEVCNLPAAQSRTSRPRIATWLSSRYP